MIALKPKVDFPNLDAVLDKEDQSVILHKLQAFWREVKLLLRPQTIQTIL